MSKALMAAVILVIVIWTIIVSQKESVEKGKALENGLTYTAESENAAEDHETIEEPAEQTVDLSKIPGIWKMEKQFDSTIHYSFEDTNAMLEALASFPIEQTREALQGKLDSADVVNSGAEYFFLRYNKPMDGSTLGSVNFAGKYIIIEAAGGTAAVGSWLINAETGKISRGPTAAGSFFYLPGSRLMIQDPEEFESYAKTKVFYMGDDGVLRQITISKNQAKH